MASKYPDNEYEHDSDDEFDEDIGMWVGNPLKHGDYDNEGNYIEKEEKEASPLAASEPKGRIDSVKSESRNEKYKRLMREKAAREKAERKPAISAPKGDTDLAAAR